MQYIAAAAESEVAPHRRFVFAEFEVDLDRGTLTRRGQELPLRPKSFAVLQYLLEHASRLVPREELMAVVWPGVVVTDDSIAQCLIELRKALGDDTRSMIRTVPRRGLIFDIPVHIADGSEPDSSPSEFRPLSLRAAGTWVAASVILAVAGLLLWSTASLSRFADPVVVKAAQTAEATRGEDAHTGHGLHQREPDLEAHRLVLQGQALYRQRAPGDMQRARDLFLRAARLDPDYAIAWARLAAAMRVLYVKGQVTYEELIRTGLPAATRALDLRPDLAEVQFRAANYAALVGDNQTALAYYAEARRIDPDSPLVLGWSLGLALYSGDVQSAVDAQTRTIEVDPLSPVERVNMVDVLFYAGQFDAMREQAAIAMRLNPGNKSVVANRLLLAAIIEHRFEEAVALLDDLEPGIPRDLALALLADRPGHATTAADARLRLRSGDSVDSAFALAEVQAWLGDTDAAFESLARARAHYETAASVIPVYGTILISRISPFLVPLHGDSRWADWIEDLPLQEIFTPPGATTDRLAQGTQRTAPAVPGL